MISKTILRSVVILATVGAACATSGCASKKRNQAAMGNSWFTAPYAYNNDQFMAARGTGDINARNGTNNTPLHEAVLANNAGAVAFLLDNGANIESVDEDLETPLFFAVDAEAPALVGLLLTRGANANARDEEGATPLMHAAGDHRHESLKVLLQSGKVEIDARDNDGYTALHHAAADGHTDCIAALLQAGANPRVRDLKGRTPLAVAMREDQMGSVSTLRQAGVTE